MKRASEKKHWDVFWSGSRELEDVYGTDRRIVETLSRHVDLKGLAVLEVGAGTGRDAGEMASLGAEVSALDYSEESLKLMRSALGGDARIVCGDATALPFRSESFDVVYHQGLLEHFRNPSDVLDENVRILKHGGILLVDVPQRYHYYTLAKHALIAAGKWFAGWESEFSVAQLRKLVEQRGLRVLAVYGHNMSPPIWYRGVRRALLKSGLRLPMYPKGPRWLSRFARGAGSFVPRAVRTNTALVIACVAEKP
jgi:ubiquinone/menaquinone biosynthesis C-methylase UbiE